MTPADSAAVTRSDRLRILHVRNTDRISGPERLLLQQCRQHASEVQHIVTAFATAGREPELLAAARDAGATAIALPQRSSYDRGVLRALDQVLERERPDVVVGHDYKANWAMDATARRRALPRVAIVHGYTGENLKIRFFESRDRKRLRSMDAVVCVSEAQRGLLEQRGVPADRLRVIPNAIDADAVSAEARKGRELLRRHWGLQAGRLVVLSLGRLSPEKGHVHLLHAFAACPAARNATLVLVGEGPEGAALQRRACQPDLKDRVVFAGWRSDPSACLGAADVFALPSLREGLPLALLEAMAVGLPIVASAVGGVPDAVGDTATLVPAGDVAALSAALAALLPPSEALHAAAQRASQRVREHFDAQAQTRALEAIYQFVCG